MVKVSGILFFPIWEISSSIALDAIRKDLSASIYKENFDDKMFGLRFIPRLHTLEIWSMTPNIGKPKVVKFVEEMISTLVVKRATKITPTQAT